ncbi:MAG: methylated-DNA--[protein]-cysteine S-methyltransferase [Alphaproteobacteria bacterium]|nr:methylated-DNA--[protein]-cysteine S-methyltransferase [Alphaproteobacteria bacterium]
MPHIEFLTPIGPVILREEAGFLVSLDWGRSDRDEPTDLLRESARQIAAYFNRERRTFTLPLNPRGTVFQSRVWAALLTIPYGSTETYGHIARSLGFGVRGAGARAVGGACGRNPLPILIPCHRVISSNGTLGGYSGPETVKPFLLSLESSQP